MWDRYSTSTPVADSKYCSERNGAIIRAESGLGLQMCSLSHRALQLESVEKEVLLLHGHTLSGKSAPSESPRHSTQVHPKVPRVSFERQHADASGNVEPAGNKPVWNETIEYLGEVGGGPQNTACSILRPEIKVPSGHSLAYIQENVELRC